MICKKIYGLDIPNKIIEIFTLVQLMNSLVNVNHAISIVGLWIFDSNYKKSLSVTYKLIYLICSFYSGKELVAMFWFVFYAVRYIWTPISL